MPTESNCRSQAEHGGRLIGVDFKLRPGDIAELHIFGNEITKTQSHERCFGDFHAETQNPL